MDKYTVDIIIPTYNPGTEFDTVIEKLHAQTVSPHKVIIFNTDESMWKKDYSAYGDVEVHHITKEEFNHGGTRNAAVKCSNAPYFICMTQDAVPADEHMIEELLSQMGEGVKLCYARQLPKADADEVEAVTREFNYPDKSFIKNKDDLAKLGIKTFFSSNVCAAYDREVFDKLGGFDETDFNEDMIYASKVIKSDYSICYCAEAQVYHSHNLTGREQYLRNKVLAKSQKEHPEIFEGVSSESEGVKLVKTSIRRLTSDGHWYKIPKLIWISGCKYLGFRKGKK